MASNGLPPLAPPKVIDAFLNQKLRFWSLAAMVCLVYVHAFNLHPRYLEPWTQVREPLTWGNGLQYSLANGLLRFRIPILKTLSQQVTCFYRNPLVLPA